MARGRDAEGFAEALNNVHSSLKGIKTNAQLSLAMSFIPGRDAAKPTHPHAGIADIHHGGSRGEEIVALARADIFPVLGEDIAVARQSNPPCPHPHPPQKWVAHALEDKKQRKENKERKTTRTSMTKTTT